MFYTAYFHTVLLQPFYGSLDFVRDNPGEPVPEESLATHTYHNHHFLPASCIFYNPWHPPCSIYVPDSLFLQSLSKFSLIYLFSWHPPLYTPYISSPNHCLLFAAHAHTIAIYFVWYRNYVIYS